MLSKAFACRLSPGKPTLWPNRLGKKGPHVDMVGSSLLLAPNVDGFSPGKGASYRPIYWPTPFCALEKISIALMESSWHSLGIQGDACAIPRGVEVSLPLL